MKRFLLAAGTFFLITFSISVSHARSEDLFSISGIASEGTQTVSKTISFSTAQQFVDQYNNSNLKNLFSIYTNNSGVNTTASFRGLPIVLQYAANSTTLSFHVPAIGLNKDFTGVTRDDSVRAFTDFLKRDGGSLITQLEAALASNTAADPIAGNPNSLVAAMANANFNGGDAGTVEQGRGVRLGNAFALSLQSSLFSASGVHDGTAISLPIGYTFVFSDPRYALTVDLPLTFVERDRAQSYMGSFGASLRFPVAEHWYLTPSVRVGAVGSVDEYSAAIVYSAAMTSSYNIYYKNIRFNFQNSAGYYKSAPVSIGGVKIDSGTENGLFKNGVSAESELNFKIFDLPTSVQAYAIDNETTGNAAYIAHWVDLGMSFGTRQRPDSHGWNVFRTGVGVSVGDRNYKAFQINAGLKF